ncbi:competence type IV pilus minor pilin ComGD [Streptococcus dentapri]|uniref:Competence type IV pilus minor pilin ComGD n=1 Tax=Streptococcus dentapri TaxID=573564 RepID=A0ABV8D1V7_9STRE
MYKTKAFTLLESLLVLALTSFFLLTFTGSVKKIFTSIEEKLFFLSFEHFYQDTQKLSAARQKEMTLTISDHRISNNISSLAIPTSIHPSRSYNLDFSPSGGNSSLEKLQFLTEDKSVTYQLYIGSGRYKKTEN